jgi:hypothetical protein
MAVQNRPLPLVKVPDQGGPHPTTLPSKEDASHRTRQIQQINQTIQADITILCTIKSFILC